MDTQDVFWRPVDPQFAPRYYHIIKEPMWFQKIIDKIELFQYQSWSEIVHDFNLITQNAKRYNTSQSIYHKLAKNLERYGLQLLELYQDDGKEALKQICKGKYQKGWSDAFSLHAKIRQLMSRCRHLMEQVNFDDAAANQKEQELLQQQIYNVTQMINTYHSMHDNDKHTRGLGVVGLPRCQPSFSGVELYRTEAPLAAEDRGQPSSDPLVMRVAGDVEAKLLHHRHTYYRVQKLEPVVGSSSSLQVRDVFSAASQQQSESAARQAAAEKAEVHQLRGLKQPHGWQQHNSGALANCYQLLQQRARNVLLATLARSNALEQELAEHNRQFSDESLRKNPSQKVFEGRAKRRRLDGEVGATRTKQATVIKVPPSLSISQEQRNLYTRAQQRIKEHLKKGLPLERLDPSTVLVGLDVRGQAVVESDTDEHYLALHQANEEEERQTYLNSIGAAVADKADKRKQPERPRSVRSGQRPQDSLGRCKSMPNAADDTGGHNPSEGDEADGADHADEGPSESGAGPTPLPPHKRARSMLVPDRQTRAHAASSAQGDSRLPPKPPPAPPSRAPNGPQLQLPRTAPPPPAGPPAAPQLAVAAHPPPSNDSGEVSAVEVSLTALPAGGSNADNTRVHLKLGPRIEQVGVASAGRDAEAAGGADGDGLKLSKQVLADLKSNTLGRTRSHPAALGTSGPAPPDQGQLKSSSSMPTRVVREVAVQLEAQQGQNGDAGHSSGEAGRGAASARRGGDKDELLAELTLLTHQPKSEVVAQRNGQLDGKGTQWTQDNGIQHRG